MRLWLLDHTATSEREDFPGNKAPLCVTPALLPLTGSLFILQTASLSQQAVQCQQLLVHWAWESGSLLLRIQEIQVQFQNHFMFLTDSLYLKHKET